MANPTAPAELGVRQIVAREAMRVAVKPTEKVEPLAQTAQEMRKHAGDKKDYLAGMGSAEQHAIQEMQKRTDAALEATALRVESIGYSVDANGQKTRVGEGQKRYDAAKQSFDTAQNFIRGGFSSLDVGERNRITKWAWDYLSTQPDNAEVWATMTTKERESNVLSWLNNPDVKTTMVQHLERLNAAEKPPEELDRWTKSKAEALKTKAKIEQQVQDDEAALKTTKDQYDDEFGDLAATTQGKPAARLEELTENQEFEQSALAGYEQRLRKQESDAGEIRGQIDFYHKRNEPVPVDLQAGLSGIENSIKEIQDRITPLQDNKKELNRLTRRKNALNAKIEQTQTRYDANKTALENSQSTFDQADENIKAAAITQEANEKVYANTLNFVINGAVTEAYETNQNQVIMEWRSVLPDAEQVLSTREAQEQLAQKAKFDAAVRDRYVHLVDITEKKAHWHMWKKPGGAIFPVEMVDVTVDQIVKKDTEKMDQDWKTIVDGGEDAIAKMVDDVCKEAGMTTPLETSEEMKNLKAALTRELAQARKLAQGYEATDVDLFKLGKRDWFDNMTEQAIREAPVQEVLKAEGIELTPEEAKDLKTKNPTKFESIRALAKKSSSAFLTILLGSLMVAKVGGEALNSGQVTGGEGQPQSA